MKNKHSCVSCGVEDMHRNFTSTFVDAGYSMVRMNSDMTSAVYSWTKIMRASVLGILQKMQ